MKTKKLSLRKIAIDGGTQPRASIDEFVVAEYKEALKSGDKFPPIVVFADGKKHWLADGFHRYHAHRKLKKKDITCEVRKGTLREAILFSLSANAAHGLRRSNEDKRHCVMKLLKDEEWGKWSDTRIAQKCGVSQPFVGNQRRSLKTVISERRVRTKHGAVTTMRTENIGRGRGKEESGDDREEEMTPKERKKQKKREWREDYVDRESTAREAVLHIDDDNPFRQKLWKSIRALCIRLLKGQTG